MFGADDGGSKSVAELQASSSLTAGIKNEQMHHRFIFHQMVHT